MNELRLEGTSMYIMLCTLLQKLSRKLIATLSSNDHHHFMTTSYLHCQTTIMTVQQHPVCWKNRLHHHVHPKLKTQGIIMIGESFCMRLIILSFSLLIFQALVHNLCASQTSYITLRSTSSE